MSRVLFVSNGHGEAAIADRIAVECAQIAPALTLDHLALVDGPPSPAINAVGPRRAMPSGGLIAMGNVRNILRDVRAGLVRLTFEQLSFLRASRQNYAAAVAVGDAYALFMSAIVRVPMVFVGTAKSAYVAPYGPFERRLLSRCAACFVRDEATVRMLAQSGHAAEAANVIADLFAQPDRAGEPVTSDFNLMLALFPGSRAGAYADGKRLLEVVRELAMARPSVGAVLSIASGLEPARFADAARQAGWDVVPSAATDAPFELAIDGQVRVRAWRGSLGALLKRATIVVGQAGTANEGAAALGIPVTALADRSGGKPSWYRRRQQGLLGAALLVLPPSAPAAADAIAALLDDPVRRGAMGREGTVRMGQAGAARRIATRIARLADRSFQP